MSIPSSVGRYRIDRVLGSGAFASVWLGHDDALAVSVAIKVLSGSLLDDLDVCNRFLEEARILRRADSERMVRVHDIGELPDGRPYFVMSYADRGSLADRMRERLISVPEALYLAEEIARGVDVVNRLGVIHRDLKPSNVLFQSTINGTERLLIADLGLAKALAHASGAFTLPVGTPGYMSPEQARFGGGLDVRADVYGVGALTYHLLTGRAPGQAPVRVPPSALRPEVPPAVDQLVMRAIEANRESRWPTADAFAQAVAGLRAAMSAPAAGPSGPTAAPEQQPGPQQIPPPGPPPAPPPGSPRPGPLGPPPAMDDTATTEIRLPSAATPEATTVDDDATVLDQGGGTAAYPSMPQSHEPAGARFPPPRGADRKAAPEERAVPRSGGSARRLLVPAGIAAGILVVAIAAGLLFGNLFGGDSKAKSQKTQLPAGFSTVRESAGHLSVTVPTAWAKQQEETWVPASVGLVGDNRPEPVLRATPDLTQFRTLKAATPGVFVGITRDLTAGRLPPPAVSQHSGCTREQPKPYQRGTLKGTIIRWVRCDGGPISFSEIGLVDTGDTFGLWIRVKQIDSNDLTVQILDSLQVKAP